MSNIAEPKSADIAPDQRVLQVLKFRVMRQGVALIFCGSNVGDICGFRSAGGSNVPDIAAIVDLENGRASGLSLLLARVGDLGDRTSLS